MKAFDSNFSLFLENNLGNSSQRSVLFYEKPSSIITILKPDDLENGFFRIEKALADGFHVAGWMSYEAGLCLEDKLSNLLPKELKQPLLVMGVFKERQVLSAADAEAYWQKFENPAAFSLENLRLNQSQEQYDQAFSKIKNYLDSGDIYQVNYSQKVLFNLKGSSKSLYASLRNTQPVEYAAYIESDFFNVLSLSPELLIKKNGRELITKPMKGTCKRGRTLKEDKILAEKLHSTEKERAENLMIVDLLRNDLSKLAMQGSVKVKSLFDVEKYPTFFTMTSTIAAELKDNKSIPDILKSVFPCGSITGAPKIRAQEIINELEIQQRGIYTGAIGFFTPESDLCFSVPIRTITIDKSGKGELGVGGGIVADSSAQKEHEESLLKAKFLEHQHQSFELVESILWSAVEGLKHLDSHLDRLQNSALYFNYNFERQKLEKLLNEHVSSLNQDENLHFKIRLLLSKNGDAIINSEAIDSSESPNIVILSNEKVDSNNPFYFHKTTVRDLYDQEIQKYKNTSALADVIFINENKELTEGTRTNLFIKTGKCFYTPPIECGLLNGIYRQQMFNNESINCVEKVLYPNDLMTADQIYLCNSIRGMMPVQLADK